MTKPTSRAYYVTARDGSNRRTAWLCGPFRTRMAALMMVRPVEHAARHHSGDDRYKRAGFAVMSRAWKDATPGSLSLQLLTLPDVWPLIASPIIV